MNELVTVYSAEVLRRLRSRAFMVGLIIGALGILAMMRLPTLINTFAAQSDRVILAGDPALMAKARPLLKDDYNVTELIPSLTSPTTSDLQTHGQAACVIVLTRGTEGIRISVYARNPRTEMGDTLRRDLLPLQVGYATKMRPQTVEALLNMPVAVKPIGSKFGSVSQADQARVVANVLIVLLYLLIVLNSQLIMTSVAEEKTSRIAELLVASVNPSTLLIGKIAASATLAIVQLIVWVAIGIVLGSGGESRLGTSASSSPLSLSGVSGNDIAGFVIFFLIGYLQMATMFAAVGSLINRTEDIGSIGGPFFVPIVGAFFLAITALQVPDAPFIVTAGFIPLVAPFVMFARIVVSTVPLWQIVLSFIINVAAIVIISILAGKIYRIGMLLYGRPPKLIQLWHALKAPS
ncbi:MAG TPA: ABC transporter permease [Candidatus Baltobacteraceae bacterium]|jgi:ABC-2 type transport system permease protein|nr:ABC transporter permease [Candidatus Baltobacteraceae bacterium]